MVKLEDWDKFIDDVIETFGFLLAQEIATNPNTPRDTSRMARSFPATFKYNKTTKKIEFTAPFYTKFVHNGTKFMVARPFVIQTFHQKGEKLLKQAFRIVDKKYK